MTIATRHSEAAVALPEPGMLIAGDWVTKTNAGTLDRIDPTTNELLSSFPVAGPEEVDRAVRAATAAFPAWKRTPVNERRDVLLRIAGLLSDAGPEFRQISALEGGHPSGVMTVEPSVDWLRYYAGWADKLAGEVVHSYPARALDYALYEPYGVVGAILPWNGPLHVATMKMAPALAAGNCVVLKTPEQSPFAVMRFAQICREAGLPDGVLNVLNGGPEVGEAIIRHSGVRKVSFTGGPGVGSKVMALAAESLTPVVMELGGKSANLIFADADLENAVQMATMMSAIIAAGQGCLFPTRLLVQDTVYDEVVERAKVIAESALQGDPLDPSVVMGAVIGEAAFDRIMGYIDIGRNDGTSRLVTGGSRLGGELERGFFIKPTIFADVDNSSRIAQEEIFGPVLSIIRFRDEEEAVAIANDSRFGLAAYLHTKDLSRAHRVADELDAGWIGVNSFPAMTPTAPFGGVKASGFGREGGRAGIEEYVYPKNISILL
jgi:aldehyde dehydrogenase (NAD+)